MHEYSQKAQTILANNIYATIATTDKDNNPWAAPQFVDYHQDARAVYWCAANTSQHAQNILFNHKAYIAVYDSSVGPGEGEGVYMQATADAVTAPDEIATAMERLVARHQGVPYWTLQDVQNPESPVTVFKAQVTRMWVNDGKEDGGHFGLFREPVTLPSNEQ